MPSRNSFTYKLTAGQQQALIELLKCGNFRPTRVEHTIAAAKTDDCIINLYKSGKCLIQGKGAEEFVTFTLEPLVLQTVGVGYEDVLNPAGIEPHMGIDESGKGDFFGPLVIAAAYVDPELAEGMRKLDVKDSKNISSDDKALGMGRELRSMLGNRFSIVKIGPEAYNRLYGRMRNVNTLLAWGHARAIENLLEAVPDCPRAISDQFGSKQQVERALMKKGRSIDLVQQHKAESDLAVAAASVIARETFLRSLRAMAEEHGLKIPKGASVAVREAAARLARQKGPAILVKTAKCHFKTADDVLAAIGEKREALGPDGQAVSRPIGPDFRRKRAGGKPES
jgi:ribonuclease HIII